MFCFSSNCCPESVVQNSHSAIFQKPQEDLACAAWGTYDCHPQEATASGRTTSKTAGRRSVQSPGGRLERRERHNSNERLRRKKIRSLCNELNTLVPSCTAATDTVNTLQSTCTFLKYIKTLYGDNLTSGFPMFTIKTFGESVKQQMDHTVFPLSKNDFSSKYCDISQRINTLNICLLEFNMLCL
ncbi:uncharacterized protein LOC133555087 isoform X1 [Nerophis ophidion]|uniref:uncharacterized protein LOC133555087 isoform X1 n=1 Tax=Nerophis ophidion TaxID=159077 RepID=UPI002ADFB62A|nr:uncharacterized protein LOC133555087 isoform X1 [Nerophis ophidion]XP_061760538.1 uncharacterized protein LOC133555087 isoform X1 [Nerophis ophidion]XP_061760540.1 uncharacterized protein LOC133555087 isoform X1 [Nerophis ophidion]XP_061760541.1 uncharacterized protein LOC133555087 isoform X1 [Nerophis ophidion]